MDNNLDPKLEKIKLSFIASLKENFEKFEDFTKLLLNNKIPDPDSILEVKFLMHKIIGTASIFGFVDLSDIARKIEDILKNFDASKDFESLKTNMQEFMKETKTIIS